MQVLFTPDLWVPLVNLHGVYILPGIPRLFKAMIEANKGPFKGPANSSRTLYTNTVEGDLAGELYAARHSQFHLSMSSQHTLSCSVPAHGKLHMPAQRGCSCSVQLMHWAVSFTTP